LKPFSATIIVAYQQLEPALGSHSLRTLPTNSADSKLVLLP